MNRRTVVSAATAGALDAPRALQARPPITNAFRQALVTGLRERE